MNSVVGTPAANKPVAVPTTVEGKPATATHFSLTPNKSSQAKPIAPVAVPEDVKWSPPVVAVKSKQPGGEKALVTYVGDGDGASLKRKDGSELNCRIETIDAPETAKPKYGKAGQPYGEEAKRTLQRLIANKEVTVTVTQPAQDDQNYGRALCRIEVEGKGVDALMLKEGAAWLYRKYGKAVDPALESVEANARKVGKGLWADPEAENPFDFRRRQQQK